MGKRFLSAPAGPDQLCVSWNASQILSSHVRQSLSGSLWNLLKHEESGNY